MTTVATTNGSTTDTAEETNVPEALAAGLLGVESARRVGWAKAFENMRRVESLSEDLRQTRDELKVLRRAYSRLLGFVTHLPFERSQVFQHEMSTHVRAEESFRHTDDYNHGWSLSWDYKAEIYGWTKEELEANRRLWRLREKARRIRTFDGHDQRVHLRNLYFDADRQGHRTEMTDHPEGMAVASCSCGLSSGLLRRFDAVEWRRNHWAEIVHGCSFKEWWKTILAPTEQEAAEVAEQVAQARAERENGPDRMLSAKELAERYGVHVSSIYRWSRPKTTGLQPKRYGRLVRYKLADLLEWEAELQAAADAGERYLRGVPTKIVEGLTK